MRKLNYDLIATQISNWLSSYLKNSGLKRFIVGVSGGIDSAVVSTLCARTGLPVTVVNIPIESKKNNTELSHKHCTWLASKFSNVEYLTVDMSEAYKKFHNTISLVVENNNLSNANTKSRTRMMVLYHIATAKGGIVVGTGNKVEDFGVGFFTKYGDGGVDISPIADLMKSEVRQIGRNIGVIEEIINVAPTDGLWEDNRTDEDQIGASYEELEWAMCNDKPIEELTERERKVIEIYNGYNTKNKHKMIPIPIFKVEHE